MRWTICLLGLAVSCIPCGAQAQTAQEAIERTIGGLVIQNASCSSQTTVLGAELQKVRAELAELKAKFPDGAKPEASSVPP